MSFPIQFQGISSQEQIRTLQNYLDNHIDSWGNVDPNDYWKGRTLFHHDITDIDTQSIMTNVIRKGISLITEQSDNKDPIYCEHLSLARWPEGYALQPHADAENPEDCPAHEFPWRHYACITFLNEDFEGGVLHFPELNIKVIAKEGYSICFPGTLKYLHGVTTITKGVRYTIASFLTHNESKAFVNI
tara:strand:- start:3269 stop:3832 length:564 start_codon:yes stop_codon:yes gene_type:complete